MDIKVVHIINKYVFMKSFCVVLTTVVLLGIVSCNKNEDTTDHSGNSYDWNNPIDPTNPTDPSYPTDPTGTVSFDNYVQCGETCGEWVDLELPSGILWYSVNIGATAPENYGDYFAWGECHTKDTFNWNTYIWGNNNRYYSYGSYYDDYHLYKYNDRGHYGVVDNKMILEDSDDVATMVLGYGARMAMPYEWEELRNNTTGEWTELNGVNGWKFTSNNGRSIFLPAAGHRGSGGLYQAGTSGGYWSKSLKRNYPPNLAVDWGFSSYVVGDYFDEIDRYFGKSVRAVHDGRN